VRRCGQDERSQRIRNTALTSLGCEVGLQFFFLLLCACKPLQQPIRVRAGDKERLPREVDSWNTSLMDVADAISGEARRFLLRYCKLSKSDSQQQNQCTGFSIGEWSRPPELFRTAENLVLRLESKSGVKFIGVQGNEIESMRREPDLKNAERLTLTESNENSSRMKSMEPMKPMH
jgi:hypothetical protein